ncbi:hypothetical protein Amsp01_087440 [Amycolatopsis sp. NBRC 101858]|uniref:hypothetical protein n=1 Tax=Amycolatopsis sp. NBRC 101858 TaxID=3032200 RepID=UPI0024A1E75F|nr:hypothetical protein [Amycolatopsis sp. NBRC 101858]GLY42721.1 hypothetical protein Amsp01_087440 [Amycolatopsis sp. NBRC 101858]
MTAVAGPSEPAARSEDSSTGRLVALVYGAALRAGVSRRSAARLCARHVPAVQPGQPPERAADARLVRMRVVRAVRSELVRRRAAKVVDEALADAVLLDELALLPPRQQFAVRSAVRQGWSVSEIVEATGWTRAQAIRLLNAGLSTITASAPGVTSPSRPSAKMAR